MVVVSSCEAEYIVASYAACQALYMARLFIEGDSGLKCKDHYSVLNSRQKVNNKFGKESSFPW